MKESSKIWWLITAWVIALLAVVIAMQAAPFDCKDCNLWIWDVARGLCLVILVGGTLWTMLFIIRQEYNIRLRKVEEAFRLRNALTDEIRRRTWLLEKEEDLKKKELEILEKHDETANKLLKSRWATDPEIKKLLEQILKSIDDLKKNRHDN